jgi:pimeloyl-ACP methyl ester carboxylesterase
MKPAPFSIAVEQSSLDELNRRLRQTRWPDEPADAGWGMGTNLAFMRMLAEHWLTRYDWRAQERLLNELPQLMATVDGEDIHLFHSRAPEPSAIPLLLLHGWPDSNFRFAKVIPTLTQAADGPCFHVVAPSLPGFGYSTHRAMNNEQTASLLVKLMGGLGYDRFMVAGGDIGAILALTMADVAPPSLLGMHLTDVGYPDHTTDVASLSPPEQEFAKTVQDWWMREGAYAMVQSTKPQSLAFAMNDSPVGLAAWILSFMSSEHPEKTLDRFNLDDLITNICIYWFTQTAPASFRAYFESAKAMYGGQQPLRRSAVPAAVLHPAWDAPLPREWANRRTNLQRFTELPASGHFAAWEKPAEFVADLRQFATGLSQPR